MYLNWCEVILSLPLRVYLNLIPQNTKTSYNTKLKESNAY